MKKYIKASEDYISKYGCDYLRLDDGRFQWWLGDGCEEVILNTTDEPITITVYDSGNSRNIFNHDSFGNPVDSARHSPFSFSIVANGQKLLCPGVNNKQDLQIHNALKDGSYEVSVGSNGGYDWFDLESSCGKGKKVTAARDPYHTEVVNGYKIRYYNSIPDVAYDCADIIAGEIRERGVMGFDEVNTRIEELSGLDLDTIYDIQLDTDVGMILGHNGIYQNLDTGDFYTEEYAEEHPEVAEE